MYRGVRYLESLCGLLHDIGKPLLRYKLRVNEGVEEADTEILELLGNLKDHNEISKAVIKYVFGVDADVCTYFEYALRYADRLAAAERGLGDYPWLRGEWENIEKAISKTLNVKYGHHYTPLLSPLWIQDVTGYINFIGPCGHSSYSADRGLWEIHKLLKPIIDALDNRNLDDLRSRLSSLIGKLKDKPLWLPPVPLTRENLLRVGQMTYSEAYVKTDYRGISKNIITNLMRINKAYDGRVTRGFIDTTSELLRYTVLTVPAAIYAALLPDTSLYSHLKIVSAYSSILSMGINKFKLMALDARGIQEFIASPLSAKAASRVIRGRSFLAELVSMSLLNYVLELYGGLPYVNVITSEGGTLSLIVPALSSERESMIVHNIKSVIKSTYERLKGLWFTVAFSREFDLNDVDYIRGLRSCTEGDDVLRCGYFFNVLEALESNLAIEKSLDDAKAIVNIRESGIEGYDAITYEPVTTDELINGYGLKIANAENYASVISGGKLESNDIISEVTHLSLVAGTCLRNLSFLISVYVYNLSGDGLISPAEEQIDDLTSLIRNFIVESTGRKSLNTELYFRDVEFKETKGYGFNIGLIPLKTLGAFHVMISNVVIEPPELVKEELKQASINVVSVVLKVLVSRLSKLAKEGLKTRVEVRAINTGLEFIDILSHEMFLKNVKTAVESGVDFHVGVLYVGTYHPFTIGASKDEGSGVPTLVDLDIYNIIAMAKIDADYLGEVKKLMSFSPTRLSSLSDMLSTMIVGKTHLFAVNYSKKYLNSGKPRGPIILYIGGDDIALYGYWVDVLTFLRSLYELVLGSFYPISFTSSVVLEKSDYPLLDLYAKVVEQLSRGKRESRGSVFIAEISSPKPIVCDENKRVITTGLQPVESNIYEQLFKPITPLEVFATISNILEKLEESPEVLRRDRSIEPYKRILRMISQVATLNLNELRSGLLVDSKESVKDPEVLYSIVRRFIALSYISSRRDKDFRDLEENLTRLVGKKVVLHHIPGEEVRNALLRAIASKTFIDILLLYLNPYSTTIHST